MCGSPAASLATFLVSCGCMGYVWTRRGGSVVAHRWLAAFLTTFATIQLVETVLWLALGRGWVRLNRWTTRFVIPAVLLAELWVNYACAVVLARWRSRVLEAALVAYSACVLGNWWRCRTTTVGDEGYLHWCAERDDLFHPAGRVAFLLLILWPILAAFPEGSLRGILLATAVLTFLHAFPRRDFGSRWCWTANATSVLSVIALVGS